MTSQNLVYKSNDLMTANYKLTVPEQRIILMCIAKISRDPTQVVTDEKMYTFTAREYAEMCEISLMAAYSDIKEAADQLFERRVIFNLHDRERKTRWIQTADYVDGEGRVELRFSKEILPLLGNLRSNFTKYSLNAVARLSSPHAFRMYDLIARHRFKCNPTVQISIDQIRFCLALDNAYPLYADLRKRVIEPALKMIDDLTDIKINGFEPIRENRKIVAIEVSYEERLDFSRKPVQESLLQENADGGSEPKSATTTKKRRGSKAKQSEQSGPQSAAEMAQAGLQNAAKQSQEPKAPAAGDDDEDRPFTQREIEKAARPGESYQQVISRLTEQRRRTRAKAVHVA